MKKSIKNKIAIMLALFGIINPKTKAVSKAQIAGYCAVSTVVLGVLGTLGYCLLGGKSNDDNNKGKSQQQENLEQSISDFLDSLPKDDKKLSNYLTTNNTSEDKASFFNSSKSVFNNYLNREAGYACISSEQDIRNNKLIIKHFDKTNIFIFENGINLKIQQNYMQGGINKKFDITISKPSRNPNNDDPLKNKIKNILDNGKLIGNKAFNLDLLKHVYNIAYNNNGHYQFDESISEKSTVSIICCWFNEEDEEDAAIIRKVTYKFILKNDKQVGIQKFIFETDNGERKEYEGVVTVF